MTSSSDIPRTLTVRVAMAIEVDGQAWGEIYGSGGWPSDLRAQVKDYAINQLAQSAAAAEGAIVTVTRS